MQLVYIIGSETGPFKIGVSGNLKRRLYVLQQESSCPLKLFGYAAVANRIAAFSAEKNVHYVLRDNCVGGEWFKCHPDDIKIVMRRLGLKVTDSGVVPKDKPTPDYVPARMESNTFEHWYQYMRSKEISQDSMATILGTTSIQIARWRKSGAPPYIGLACAAIEENLSTWSLDAIRNNILKPLAYTESPPDNMVRARYCIRQSSDGNWWVCRDNYRMRRFLMAQDACDLLTAIHLGKHVD